MKNNNNPSFNSFLGKRKEATNSGFTLVELIVVITILAILGTIAFISLSGYSATSRDSVRLSDVSSMTTALEIYHVNSGKYPLPDEKGEFTLSGETMWSQGFFGDSVVSNLSRSMSEAPLDPLSEKRYVYSVDGIKNAFQLLNPLEGDEVSNITHPNPLLIKEGTATISQTNAAGVSKRTARVSGSFNGLFVRTASYILPIPSIITSISFNAGDEVAVTGVSDITSQVVSGGANMPGNIGNTNTGTTGLSGLAYKPVEITSVETSNDKSLIMIAIKEAYENETSLSNDGIYNYVINVSGEDNLAAVYDTIIVGDYEDVKIIKTNTSCGDIPTGGTKDFYSASSIVAYGNCDTVKTTFTCDDNVWKDGESNADTATYQYETCFVEDDTVAPTGGSMIINSNASTTNTTSVTLNITCPTDAEGSSIEVAYGNTSSANNWINCTATKSHILASGNGIKTVYYKFRDLAGNETVENSDSISLETNILIGSITWVKVDAGKNTQATDWFNACNSVGKKAYACYNYGNQTNSNIYNNGSSFNSSEFTSSCGCGDYNSRSSIPGGVMFINACYYADSSNGFLWHGYTTNNYYSHSTWTNNINSNSAYYSINSDGKNALNSASSIYVPCK